MKKRKTGLPPGTLIYTGNKVDLDVTVTYTVYNSEEYEIEIYDNNSPLHIHQSEEHRIQWYDVRGLHDTELIKNIANTYEIHALAMEDIVDVHKRPSHVEYSNGHFISLKTFEYDKESNEVKPQSISIFLGNGFILTFQEYEDDIFRTIRDRISKGNGRLRKNGTDYLAYSLIDLVVDNFYHVLDRAEETLEEIEDKISFDIDSINKGQLQATKVNLIKIRKSVVPLREALNQLIRSESELIDPKTEKYLRDVHNHTIQLVESADTLRDILSGLQDLYLAELSMKMNAIMQFLTIVTAIFVPLSFLTGLYGMNFEKIPELKYQYGYYILLAVMLFITVGMLYWFKKKKWL